MSTHELPASEIEKQTSRIQGLLMQGYKEVWTNRRFPNSHVPDILTLRQNISIGSHSSSGFKLFPLLKPEYRTASEDISKALDEEDAIKKVAWYDPFTREMTFYLPVLGLPDQELRRVVYHEAATDTFGREISITPDQYSPDQLSFVDEAIKEAILPDAGITVNDTRIAKLGFRRLLMIDEFGVSDMDSGEFMLADEVYPNAFEIITDQIMRRQGDIRSFDQDAKNGRLQISIFDANVNFAQALFAAMRVVDWRDILTAFKTGDKQELVGHLRNTSTNPNYAEDIVVSLMKAIMVDEQNVYSFNNFLLQRGE